MMFRLFNSYFYPSDTSNTGTGGTPSPLPDDNKEDIIEFLNDGESEDVIKLSEEKIKEKKEKEVETPDDEEISEEEEKDELAELEEELEEPDEEKLELVT